ncbi:hypothetical protein [Blastopirellula marina]|uniref:Mercuric reductase n=1 Tax=Blastopirellula marina DSM 3645 TaxID=314230 RepID=A3ZMG8_9BACT|nr:hypothetical protein [Blastopirellula marina]EAQ82141.1 mercuric reductase [Blastopirellula marina DSM 3645]
MSEYYLAKRGDGGALLRSVQKLWYLIGPMSAASRKKAGVFQKTSAGCEVAMLARGALCAAPSVPERLRPKVTGATIGRLCFDLA